MVNFLQAKSWAIYPILAELRYIHSLMVKADRISVVSSINKKACLLACLLENSTKFTQPLILETFSKPL